MAENPYRPLANVALYRAKAGEWFAFARKYPIVWNFRTFKEFAEWRNQTNPNISLDEWDNLEYFQEYYKIYPEGRQSENELEEKAHEYDQEEARRVNFAQKQLRAHGEQHAGTLSSFLLLPSAIVERYRLADSLEKDSRYQDILNKLKKDWEKRNPGTPLGNTFLHDKNGNEFLNPTVLQAIPSIHQDAAYAFREKFGRRARKYDKRDTGAQSHDYTLDPKIQQLYRDIQTRTSTATIEKLYNDQLNLYQMGDLQSHGFKRLSRDALRKQATEDTVLEFVKGNFAAAETYASQNSLIAKALETVKEQRRVYTRIAQDPAFQAIEQKIKEQTAAEIAAAQNHKKDLPKNAIGSTVAAVNETGIAALVRRRLLERFVEEFPEKAAGYARTNPEIREVYEVWKREQADRIRRTNSQGVEKSPQGIYESYLHTATEEAQELHQQRSQDYEQRVLKGENGVAKPLWGDTLHGAQDAAILRFIEQHPLYARELTENNPLIKKHYEAWRASLRTQSPMPPTSHTSDQPLFRPRPYVSPQTVPQTPPASPQQAQRFRRPSLPHLPRNPFRKTKSLATDQAKQFAKKTAMRLVIAYAVPIGIGLLILMLIVFIIVFICVIIGKCTIDNTNTPGGTTTPILSITKTGPEAVSDNTKEIPYVITVSYQGPDTTVTVVDKIFGDADYVSADPAPQESDIVKNSSGALQSITWRIPITGTSTESATIQASEQAVSFDEKKFAAEGFPPPDNTCLP